jgi:hypothetical protein
MFCRKVSGRGFDSRRLHTSLRNFGRSEVCRARALWAKADNEHQKVSCYLQFLPVYPEEDRNMRSTAKKIDPEDYILSVLSPKDRLDAAFLVAREAFRKTKLTIRDIDRAVDSVRRKTYGKEKKSSY